MSRGHKLCQKCGASNGVRAWNCQQCGAGFMVKGTQHPDIELQHQESAQEARKRHRKEELMGYVESIDEDEYRRRYNSTGRSWISTCRCYKIRENRRFMGVAMKEHFEDCFQLLHWKRDAWCVLGYTKGLTRAIRMMLNHKQGKSMGGKRRREILRRRRRQVA